MVWKWTKRCLIVGTVAFLVGGLVFGNDVVSYVRSTARSIQEAVKDSVPIEFELRRAKDLLEDIIPEMHANIRLIAQEEVEVAALKSDIERSDKGLVDERARICKLRQKLDAQTASYSIGDGSYTRTQVMENLTGRFERFREAELVHASKEHLLETREKSLYAAMQLLEKTRAQKRLLEDKIGALESQYRVVKAASVGSRIKVDNSSLAQTEKLIAQIKKRLDVAERVLAHESRFVQSIPVDAIPEEDLLAQIDEYFEPASDKGSPGTAKDPQVAAASPSDLQYQ
ncbi:MAG: signal peptide-containing protein [Planctomycetota bacterium]|jgi:BMFP domain-containing protein YqiC